MNASSVTTYDRLWPATRQKCPANLILSTCTHCFKRFNSMVSCNQRDFQTMKQWVLQWLYIFRLRQWHSRLIGPFLLSRTHLDTFVFTLQMWSDHRRPRQPPNVVWVIRMRLHSPVLSTVHFQSDHPGHMLKSSVNRASPKVLPLLCLLIVFTYLLSFLISLSFVWLQSLIVY